MSELDTYFQPTGRKFGEAGSLQPGTMSAMERRQAVTNMQNDQRRRTELARRVQRQLGRQSRKGDVRAGMLALDFMDREAEMGQPIPAGISSFESNRARGAQTIMDNEDQIALMDAVTNGGGQSPTAMVTEPYIPPQMRLPVSVSPDGSISTVDGRTTTVMPDGSSAVTTASGEYSQQELAPASPSLAQRVASTPAAPSPSPLPAGQMDRSGSRFRVGATANGSGGMLTDSDKELLDAGRRVAGLRPVGFGSRPGGQFGLVSSTLMDRDRRMLSMNRR